MQKLTDFELLKLSKARKFLYRLKRFFAGIPLAIWAFIKLIGRFFVRLGLAIKNFFFYIGFTFAKGSWKTKTSYFVMGFANFSRKQWVKGLLFLLFEVVFIFYMIVSGGYWLSKLGSLGSEEYYASIRRMEELELDLKPEVLSFRILLYGILTIIFIICFIATWYLNVKQAATLDKIERSGKKIKSNKEDLKSLLDDNFHKTLLALPVLGVVAFTIIPIIFMILVAFTNYTGNNNGIDNKPFNWVGLQNFSLLVNFSNGSEKFSIAFGEILLWTLIWAIFATFTNYFLGMLVAMMINKKGIKGKKIFRTILVMTIAIPQLISLVYISRLFDSNGVVVKHLTDWGFKAIDIWNSPTWSRIMVIIINIWVGIPYLMLITTGILMNIPQDLYESAKIDGANGWQQYTKITLPYMLFVTGPYLLTSFIANLNNFNVIYLITGGKPDKSYIVGGVKAGETDLLVTWLYKMTSENPQGASYNLAAVIGILIFIVVATISLIVFNLLPSTRNERDFS